MTNSNTVQVGIFEVPVTKKLRDLFTRTHDRMSAHLPTERQFGTEEQLEMLVACRAVSAGKATGEEYIRRENDLCELLHYLAMNGVPVTDIHKDIRLYSARTKSVTMQLGYQQRCAAKEEQLRKASMPVFLPPVSRTLVGATA